MPLPCRGTRTIGLAVLLLSLARSGTAQQAPAASSPGTRAVVVKAMKQALRQLVTTQSIYHEAKLEFAKTPPGASATPAALYRLEVTFAEPGGWTATTTAKADPNLHCGIFVGSGPAPNAAVVAPTVPACWHLEADGSMTTP